MRGTAPGRARAVVLLLLAGLACLPSGASAKRRRSSHGNPHADVTAVAEVSEAPRRTTHTNGRSYEELSVRLLSVDPPAPASGEFAFDTAGPIRLVHDLTCGGVWVDARVGDRLDLRGEYVHTPDGHDLVHFTHPAGAVTGCGTGGTHPDGYLRPHREAAAAASWTQPPAPEIPDASVASFRQSLRPILSTRCAPCHEPGGKMYARLPFDDPGTVASHAARMGTRLKGDDLKALEAWAAEVAAASNGSAAR
jgi:hypothetical protein